MAPETPVSPWKRARPDVGADAAARILREHWGIEGELRELGSNQDRNYLVTEADGRRRVLKIDNAATTRAEVEAQHFAVEALLAAGVVVPRPSEALAGGGIVEVDGHLARLQEFIDGGTLAMRPEFGETEARALGEVAGQVVAALADVEHPGFDRTTQWDLRNAGDVVADLLDGIGDDARRRRVKSETKSALRAIAAVADELPVQPVHGDLTDDNAVRTGAASLGVIDLGDLGLGWRVAELAVAIASVLQRTGSLALAAACVDEFGRHAKLADAELAALWPLVRLRGAALVASGWTQVALDRDNEYARERMESEWRALEVAAGVDDELAEAVFRTTLGRPHRPGLEYAKLADGLGRKSVVELSPDADVFDHGGWLHRGTADDALLERLDRRAVAATRWGEHRLDRTPAPCPTAPANCALFIDVVAAGPLEVHAPFDARVEAHGDDALDLVDGPVRLRLSGLRSVAGLTAEAGEVVGTARRSTDGTSRIRVQWIAGASGAEIEWTSVVDKPALASLRPDPSRLLGLKPAPSTVRRTRTERRRRDTALGKASERYWESPPLIVRGWGQYLIDDEARPLLDLVNNVTAIGHSHPRLEKAAAYQLRTLNTNSRFLYPEYADYVERLVERANRAWPGGFDVAVPVNSGSEAVDLALRMAQVFTGRRDVVVPREAYHGWTHASDAVSTSAFDNPSAAASRPDWVHLVDAPNAYRGPHRGDGAGERYLADARERLAELDAAGTPVGGFICETVLGNAGGVIPPKGWLRGVYEAVRERGGVAIADEVQVGLGRLGSHYWGAELAGARPDIIAVAKAAGNAFPVGAVITRREILDALADEGMFFSSAAGTPLSAAVGSTVLDVIDDERLQARAKRVGKHFAKRMRELQRYHDWIGEVHGTGLYQGVELVRDRESLEPATAETARLCERMLAHGMIVQPASERQNVLKFKPPMTITEEDVDAFAEALDIELTRLTSER
ncbi:MAG: aminotransferase [Microbacteriaceae bacterium]|nr:aminotransferase [Microbacteriaceae bacterium]